MKPRARTGPGTQFPLRRAVLGCWLALAALALPAQAEATRNVYVANQNSANVAAFAFDTSGSGSLTLLGSSPFAAGGGPNGVTASPDGKHLYVSNISPSNISAFDLSADGTLSPIAGSPIATANAPFGSAISPDGSHYFVANYNSGKVSGYEIGAGGGLTPTLGSPFAAGTGPLGVAVTPDGKYLYVSNNDFLNSTTPSNISAYQIGSGGSLLQLVNSPFAAGKNPGALAVSPDGKHLYAANFRSNNISAYDIAGNGSLTQVPGSPFATGGLPYGMAASPDGKRLFVANSSSNDVSAFDIATDGALTEVIGSPYPAGDEPIGVGVTPDSSHLFVANYGIGPPDPGPYVDSSVSAYDIAPDGTLASVTSSPFATGGSGANFQSLAITPNQPPVASFTNGPAESGSPTSFDASSSTDPDGNVARYDWVFGDGTTLPDGGSTPTHTYAAVGSYDVTVTLTDNEGCTTTLVYTGQTASCNGKPTAATRHQITVAAPPAPKTKITPKTKIKGKPKYQQSEDTRFRFSSSIGGSKFKCKLDNAKYKGCKSPKNYKNLKQGKHTFSVYAISPAGVADESAAKVKFKVKGTKKG